MLQHRLTQVLTSLEDMENNIDKRTGETFNVKSFLRSLEQKDDDESDSGVSDVTQQLGKPNPFNIDGISDILHNIQKFCSLDDISRLSMANKTMNTMAQRKQAELKLAHLWTLMARMPVTVFGGKLLQTYDVHVDNRQFKLTSEVTIDEQGDCNRGYIRIDSNGIKITMQTQFQNHEDGIPPELSAYEVVKIKHANSFEEFILIMQNTNWTEDDEDSFRLPLFTMVNPPSYIPQNDNTFKDKVNTCLELFRKKKDNRIRLYLDEKGYWQVTYSCNTYSLRGVIYTRKENKIVIWCRIGRTVRHDDPETDECYRNMRRWVYTRTLELESPTELENIIDHIDEYDWTKRNKAEFVSSFGPPRRR